MGLETSAKIVNVFLFVVTIIVICSTFIPTLYKIDDNTSQLVGDGEFVFWEEQLHEDLLVMIGQLDAFNGLLYSIDENLSSMDANIAILVDPTTVRELNGKMEKLMRIVEEMRGKLARGEVVKGKKAKKAMVEVMAH